MGENLYEAVHNPDVLSCLANLSNDEVFTPPRVVNDMLDMLPQELFENPDTTFLDPACKTGVFLREIAKRLIKGLESQMPNLQERLDHIFHKQLFGIAITELTGMVARRGVYCSKHANKPFSVSQFKTEEGNIRFQRIEHTWKNGKCIYCGASQSEYDRDTELETHAYEFIHPAPPPRHCEEQGDEAIHPTKEFLNMKFDVIIGNPPYQMSDGGNSASAKPMYHLFVEQAKKLKPRYLSMIIPARWYAGGKGLDEFRDEMLHDRRLHTLVDYFDSTECFPGVDISGGVCYFLWSRDYNGMCEVITHRGATTTTLKRFLLESLDNSFIRFNEAVEIVGKIKKLDEPLFYEGVSSRKPFGFDTKPHMSPKPGKNTVKIFAYPTNGFVLRSSVKQNIEWVEEYNVCVAKSYGERGDFPYLVLGKPFLAGPGSCCSETYIVVRSVKTKQEAENIISYIKTHFFRFLVLLVKNTQDAPRRVYSFVPLQDFSKPWTDEELYKKYNLSPEEIAFIESMIRPMECEG